MSLSIQHESLAASFWILDACKLKPLSLRAVTQRKQATYICLNIYKFPLLDSVNTVDV